MSISSRLAIITSLGLGLSLALAACGGDEHGEPTGSICPDNSTLTYDNFGAQFMTSFCTRCHSTTKVGADRKGAPSDHNFDTKDDILAFAEHIDEYAAGGPDAVNTIMPPSTPRPTEEERKKLGEWLACETAK